MKYIAIFILFIIGLAYSQTQSFAESMQNNSYTLTTPDDTQSITNQSPELAIIKNGQVQPGTYTTADYTIVIGNGDTSSEPLRMKNSTDTLSYKELVPNEPIIREHTITIDPGKTTSYALHIFEESALTDEGGSIIPDTSCDSGTCTEDYPGVWANPLTYGFGFTCVYEPSSLCPDSFSKKDIYQPLPNKKNNKDKELVFKSTLPTTTTFQYKANINPTQIKSVYHNTINYILLPTI